MIVRDPIDEVDQSGVPIDHGRAENAERRVDVMGVDRIVRVWSERLAKECRPNLRRRIDVQRIGLVSHGKQEERCRASCRLS